MSRSRSGSGIKLPWRKADHSSPSRAEVKNEWSYTSNSYVFMTCVFVGGEITFSHPQQEREGWQRLHCVSLHKLIHLKDEILRRSQWPRGLRRGSAAARLLRL